MFRSYDLHANAYVSKPVDFPSFVDAVREIDEFFARTATLADLASTTDVSSTLSSGADRAKLDNVKRLGQPGDLE